MRRVTGALVGSAAAVAALGASSTAAHATEFNPNPKVSISTECTQWLAGQYTISYTNPGGAVDAIFATSVNGVVQKTVDVAPNGKVDVIDEIADGTILPVVITAPGMNDVITPIGPITCHDGNGTLQVDCVNGAPVLTGHANNTGKTMLTAQLVVNGNVAQASQASVVPGDSFTFTAGIPDNAHYTAELSFVGGYGTGASISGDAACTPPTTTTIPAATTTIPAATTTIPDPTTTVAQESPTTPEPVTLPVTGSSSGTIAVIASLITAAGIAAIRIVRRPVRSTR